MSNEEVQLTNQTIPPWDDSRVYYSPDSQVIVSFSDENDSTILNFWNPDYNLMNTLRANANSFYTVSFSPDSQIVALLGYDSIELRQPNGNLIAKLSPGHTGRTPGIVAFSPNCQFIASCHYLNPDYSHDITKLWRKDGTLVATVEDCTTVRFSPNSLFIACLPLAVNENTSVKLLRTDGTSVATFSETYDLCFSPDSQLIATWSGNIIQVLEQNGTLLARFITPEDIDGVNFSLDGQTITTTSLGTIRRWKLDGTPLDED